MRCVQVRLASAVLFVLVRPWLVFLLFGLARCPHLGSLASVVSAFAPPPSGPRQLHAVSQGLVPPPRLVAATLPRAVRCRVGNFVSAFQRSWACFRGTAYCPLARSPLRAGCARCLPVWLGFAWGTSLVCIGCWCPRANGRRLVPCFPRRPYTLSFNMRALSFWGY